MGKQVQMKRRRVVDKNRDLMSPVSEFSDEMDCKFFLVPSFRVHFIFSLSYRI